MSSSTTTSACVGTTSSLTKCGPTMFWSLRWWPNFVTSRECPTDEHRKEYRDSSDGRSGCQKRAQDVPEPRPLFLQRNASRQAPRHCGGSSELPAGHCSQREQSLLAWNGKAVPEPRRCAG